ncbi:MAG: sodium:solute symporter [Cyclobacteriaceae bacterium]|nr:sodium:solute symporter [Cyclobacteriaceae bacterium]
MSPYLVLTLLSGYFIVLLLISRFTSKGSNTNTFFTANRQSPWYLVAFGMIGASLSGVTFISVPGEVGASQFTYYQVVIGYLLGYFVVAKVLLPLYYRMQLVSIYGYLESRFGFWSYKTGAFFFLLSRTIGTAFRVFLVASVLHFGLLQNWGLPFGLTVFITIFLIWIYTFRGGIKTIVYTDTLQTLFMLLAVAISILIIQKELDISLMSLPAAISESGYGRIFEWDWRSGQNFFKQFFSGAFIVIVMTGLDQDMMQKNLTCRSLPEAQKNMLWFSLSLLLINLMFLALGALLFMYAGHHDIAVPSRTDDLYPMLAIDHFSTLAGVFFILGIIAAAYSSADSALTALTTSFCVDFLQFERKEEALRKRTRIVVHIGFSFLVLVVIMIFKALNDESVINSLFKIAGYTYGPLLGLFSYGLFTKKPLRDKWVPLVCTISIIMSYLLNLNSEQWLNGYKFGFELLIVNGFFTFTGLWLLSLGVRPSEN